MKTFLSLAFIFALLSFIPQKGKRIIVFGDSITELGVKPGGFIIKLDSFSRAAGKGFDFIGSGISANKVYDLYLRLEKDVLVKKPDVVVIFIGVNDVWHKHLLGTGTDADKFELFYQAIIDKIKRKGVKLILCTPAVIGERYDNSNVLDAELERYCNIVRALANKNNLPLVDLRNEFMSYYTRNNTENRESGVLTYDRVHLNNAGNHLVATAIWKALQGLR